MKPHGLKGEVTVSIDPDSAVNWNNLRSLYVLINNHPVPYFINHVSLKGGKAYIKFEDVGNADEARNLQKMSLYLPKSERPKLQRGQFYDDEVVGFEVEDELTGLIGIIQRMEKTGQNRFIVVKCHQKEVLIPVNGPFIAGINKSKKKVSVNLPEGFLDI